jgi:hypothetical protein
MPRTRKAKVVAGPILTLGDMRGQGFTGLWVCCATCKATRVLDCTLLPDQVPLDWFQPRLRCHECSEVGPLVRPHKMPATSQS